MRPLMCSSSETGPSLHRKLPACNSHRTSRHLNNQVWLKTSQVGSLTLMQEASGSPTVTGPTSGLQPYQGLPRLTWSPLRSPKAHGRPQQPAISASSNVRTRLDSSQGSIYMRVLESRGPFGVLPIYLSVYLCTYLCIYIYVNVYT